MGKFWPTNDENRKFWDWFLQVEEVSELPLHDDESLTITHKSSDGDQRTYSGVRLKSTLQKKSN